MWRFIGLTPPCRRGRTVKLPGASEVDTSYCVVGFDEDYSGHDRSVGISLCQSLTTSIEEMEGIGKYCNCWSQEDVILALLPSFKEITACI